MEDTRRHGRIEDTNNQVILASSISLAYIRSHIKELENEACKILTKEKASTIIISKLDDKAGCFIPITTIDVSEYNSGSFCNTELFQVEVE